MKQELNEFLENFQKMPKAMIFPLAVFIDGDEPEGYEVLVKYSIEGVLEALKENKNIALRYNKELFTQDFMYRLYDALEYRNTDKEDLNLRDSLGSLVILINREDFNSGILNKLSPLVFDNK